MPSRVQRMWKQAADDATESLGGRTEGSRHPRLVASVDGFPIEVRLVARDAEGHRVGSLLQISLPGWPTTSGLNLRRGKALSRGRFLWFDDPEWDDRFRVKAKDPDTVRLHLTLQRRTGIQEWFDSHIHDNGLQGPVIEKGQFRAVADHEMIDASGLVRHVQSLVELGKIITQ